MAVVVNKHTQLGVTNCKVGSVFIYDKFPMSYDLFIVTLNEYFNPLHKQIQDKFTKNALIGKSSTYEIIKGRYYQILVEQIGRLYKELLLNSCDQKYVDSLICKYNLECIKCVLKNYFNDKDTYNYLINLISIDSSKGISYWKIGGITCNAFIIGYTEEEEEYVPLVNDDCSLNYGIGYMRIDGNDTNVFTIN